MTDKKTTEVAERPKTADELMMALTGEITPATSRPEGLGTVGIDGIRASEMKLPRIAVAQGLSPQLAPDGPKYIQGLAIGQLFNDVTGEVYGKGPIMVVPVLRHVERLQFDPNNRNVVIARDIPWDDERMKWHGDEPPVATEYIEFPCLIIQPGRPVGKAVVSIKTTNKEQREAAKLWTTYIGLRGTDIFSGMYKITSMIARGKNREGQDTMYGHFVVANAGFVPKDTPVGDAIYKMASEFSAQISAAGFQVEREAEPDPNADPDAFDAAAMEQQAATGDAKSRI